MVSAGCTPPIERTPVRPRFTVPAGSKTKARAVKQDRKYLTAFEKVGDLLLAVGDVCDHGQGEPIATNGLTTGPEPAAKTVVGG